MADGYEFRQQGIFTAVRGCEETVIGGMIVGSAVFLMIGVYVITGLVSQYGAWTAAGALAGLAAFTAAVDILIFKVGLKGREYSFYADSIKLWITVGRDKTIFRYDKVIDIGFSQYRVFGKMRGWYVTILTEDGDFQYCVMTKGAPEDTPFYILSEKASGRLYRKTKLADSERERLLLDKGTFRSPLRHEKLIVAAGVVVLLMFALAVVFLLAFIKESQVESFDVSDMSMERFIDIGVMYLSGLLMLDVAKTAGEVMLNGGIILISLVIVWIVGSVLFRTALSGRRLEYKLTDSEFAVTTNEKTDYIYLCDVQAVYYLPFMSFGRQRGYTVQIVTKYKTDEYIWLFPNGKKFASEITTPFRLIEERCGLK